MIGCMWAGRTDCGTDFTKRADREVRAWPDRLEGVIIAHLPDPKSHFGAGRQKFNAVLNEVECLGIPGVLCS
jgi:hypothetical protein